MIERPDEWFAHRLALKLGKANVTAMLRSMSSSQFTRWRAFADLEPFGSPVEDRRFGVLASVIHGMAGKVASKAMGPADFFPLRDVKPPTLAQKIVAAFGGDPSKAKG